MNSLVRSSEMYTMLALHTEVRRPLYVATWKSVEHTQDRAGR